MQIFVNSPSGRTVTVTIAPIATIDTLKNQVLTKTGVPTASQRLVFGSKILSPIPSSTTTSLLDVGVYDGCTISLFVPLLGGSGIGETKEEEEAKESTQRQQSASTTLESASSNDTATTTSVKPELLLRIEREQELSKTNRHEVQSHWRQILRANKIQTLTTDVTTLRKSVTTELTQKNAVITHLRDSFSHSDDQFHRAVGLHLSDIDTLVDLHDDRLRALENDYTHNLRALHRDATAERDALCLRHEEEKRAWGDTVAALREDEANAVARDARDLKHAVEEFETARREEENGLRVTLESRIEELEERFEETRGQYLSETAQRTADLKNLTAEEKLVRRDVEARAKTVERLRVMLQRLRVAHVRKMDEGQVQYDALIARKRRALQNYGALKETMNRFRGDQHDKLIHITKSARASKELLRGKIRLADRIVTLAHLCRKMETEQERIIPYLHSTKMNQVEEMDNENEEWIEKGEGGNNGGNKEEEVFGEVDKGVRRNNAFDPFWKKYNKVLLDALVVEKEETRLKNERRELQDVLKKFMDGVSVNDDVIRSNNPLLVVNGRVQPSTNSKQRACGDGEKLTIVDANHVVATSRARDTLF